jgi:hypothetical protein
MRKVIFDPVFVKGKHNPPDARFGGARTTSIVSTHSSHVCLSAMAPAFAEPDIHSLSLAGEGRHRRLSVCTLPVLKQFEESLRSFDLRRSVGNRRTWQSARCVILFLSPRGPRFLGRRARGICERYEVALPPIHGEQIRYHLPSYSQRRSIGIPFLFFSFID